MEALIEDPPQSEDTWDEDLNPETHKLADFKELCKSVASLLHIEDKAAAAMLTQPLSGRHDLTEGLDAEAIFDYLVQHGVLDSNTLQNLRSTSPVVQRNRALLQHVEAEGHNAVALFINALRQSGQLHLASSLDNTSRIKPVSGSGYWEKQRHKGQVTIKIEMKALRIVAPERDSDGDMIDTSMLASPQKHLGTPHRLHHQSYENMLMLDSPDESGDRSIRIMDYPYDDEEYEKPCKRSFFCFCFPRTAKKKKVKEKKYQEQKDRTNTKSSAKEKEDLPREQNGAKSSKGVRVKSHERGRQSQAACNWSKGDAVEVTLSGDSRRNSGSPRRDFSVDLKNSINDKKSNPAAGTRQENKENTDPIIMEYNKKMELIRLRAQRSKHKNEGKSDSSSVIMCEKWKSNGRHFQKKLAAFCQQFDYDLQTYVIKYFEQDRGTLVLHVWTDGCAMYINNICLTVDQVKHLQRDLASSALRDRLDALLRSNGSLDKLDIKDIDIEVVIGDEQFKQAFQDLS